MHAHATIDAVKSRPSVQRSKKDGGSFFSGLRVQPKLTVGPVNDAYEQEADAVADRVMRMSDREVVQTHAAPPLVQMKCAHCEEEEKLQKKDDDQDRILQMKSFTSGVALQRKCAACDAEEKVQMKPVVLQRACAACASEEKVQKKPVAPVLIQKKCAACEEEEHVHRKEAITSNLEVSDSVHQTIGASGKPLDRETRAFMESRFDYDFSSIQIHDDPTAHRSSRDIHARAYTHGRHIAFAAGEYQPHTPSGKNLLAHELTHVVQQGSGTIKRKEPLIQRDPDPQKGMSRADEIKLSMTSPGEFSVIASPFTVSIFNFGINKYDLKKEHKDILNEIALLLKIIPHDKWTIVILGNADITGTPEINDPLSVNRSNAVKKYLKSKSGESFPSMGFGADLPFTTNESVGGRTRNRRVDILLFPTHTIKKPECEHPPCLPPCKNPPCKEKSLCDYAPWLPILCRETGLPCVDAGLIESLICLTLLCLFTPLSALCECVLDPKTCFCLMFPNKCLPSLPEKKRKRACLIDKELPRGDLPMVADWPILFLNDDFYMKLWFKSDDDGCDCSCGEYKQVIRGFFETVDANGKVERRRKPLTPGVYLEENVFHEDGSGAKNSEYGWRSHDAKDGTVSLDNPTALLDHFLPNKINGCDYEGADRPGFGSPVAPHDDRSRRIFLEFKGGPVDTCLIPGVRTPLIHYWHTWRVQGEIVNPNTGGGSRPGTSGPGSKGPVPSGRGTIAAKPAVPRKTTYVPGTSIQTTYEGGISVNAKPNEKYPMTFTFFEPSTKQYYYFTIDVEVKSVDANSITIVTSNADPLSLVPDAKPEVVLDKHKVVTIPKSYLK